MNSFTPKGYSQVSPYLIVSNITTEIQFLVNVFNGVIIDESKTPEGNIVHAAVLVGNEVIMLGQAQESYPPMPCMVHIYVEDCDKIHQLAINNGATNIRKPEVQFYGDKTGGVSSPNQIQYWMATHQRTVSDEELQEHFKSQSK